MTNPYMTVYASWAYCIRDAPYAVGREYGALWAYSTERRMTRQLYDAIWVLNGGMLNTPDYTRWLLTYAITSHNEPNSSGGNEEYYQVPVEVAEYLALIYWINPPTAPRCPLKPYYSLDFPNS